ncbi:MAG: hypothetical protein JWQ98_32 [Chlorobi bacterium]|nr:hypothetical protein [Chlorobiota bacterium]
MVERNGPWEEWYNLAISGESLPHAGKPKHYNTGERGTIFHAAPDPRNFDC